MPTRELVSYVEAMPAIVAERSLGRVTELGVGTGSFRESDRNLALAAWRQATRGRERVVRARTPEALAGAAAATGFGFRRVRPPDAGS